MKRASISPVTSLFLSLSLALGILVGNLNGYFLTSVHAQTGATCGNQDNNVTMVSDVVVIADGHILGGITVRNVTVNGNILEQAVIVGTVQITDATVEGSSSTVQTDGGLVGSGNPCSDGALVGSGVATPEGALVGSGVATLNGALVGSGLSVSGVNGYATGAAVGGTLTGDGIVVSNGSITGQNLLLSGTTLDQGSISGTIESVTIMPAN